MNFHLQEEDLTRISASLFTFLVKNNSVAVNKKEQFFVAFAKSLPDISDYCNTYQIRITALDNIKLLVFSIPYLKETITNFNIKNYLKSIFVLLNKSYIYNKNFSIDKLENSIAVCENLVKDNQIIPVYTYIKGFQESMEVIVPDSPYLYWHNKKSLNKITNALISVFDKTGVVEFAKELQDKNINIFSTGGSAKHLQDNGINVIDIEQYTNFPEMMDGRIKTINPKIHGGILARRDKDYNTMKQYNIPPIDLVVVNLYPFAEVISRENCSRELAIENIDIGGPAMLRAAAKNHKFVSVIVDTFDYDKVLSEIKQFANTTLATREYLALKVFQHSAKYEGTIANYLGHDNSKFANTISLEFIKKQVLRYGENPHQNAALYLANNNTNTSIANSKQIQGKELSYNNIADSDAALECVKQFTKPACVIVKHANPSGVAISNNITNAYLNAYKTDPTSAFGGIIAINRELDEKTTKTIISQQFVEVIIATSISDKARELLTKKANIRVLVCGNIKPNEKYFDYKGINGGLLLQDKDLKVITKTDFKCVSKKQATDKQQQNLLFAWQVVKFVKSNAIVYVKNEMTIGIGAGQMSRIYSAKIAKIKADDGGLDTTTSVMASDAFFPFKDSIDIAVKYGISAIIQPGGSVRDKEVIKAADDAGIVMVFTGVRHFYH